MEELKGQMRKPTRARLLRSSPPRPTNKQHGVIMRLSSSTCNWTTETITKNKNLEKVKTGQLKTLLVKVWILLVLHLFQISVEEISWLVRVSAYFVLQNTFPALKTRIVSLAIELCWGMPKKFPDSIIYLNMPRSSLIIRLLVLRPGTR